jgi:1-acyl-sn-glycerol-3-phosphate acyltransferase
MKDTFLYRFLAIIPTILFYILFIPRIKGRENIVKKGRVIFAGNHTNNLDPVMLVCTNPRQLHFLAKVELFNSFLGVFMRSVKMIPVDRSAQDKSSVYEVAENTLELDNAICIFPEGTINRTKDTIMPFKLGAVKMAYNTDSKIVPFTITNKYHLFGIGGRITLEYYEPITIKNIKKGNEKLMNVVRENLEKNK